ncbi:M50 family metallopeptidase [Streptomyces zaomyceticus]|uniref:M50 family metallopeptidase n=1 Tax=Streptomyces zaomyceticus TaxID=68286 RepID=UPI0036962B7E
MTEILGTQPPPDEWIVYLTGACALSLVVFRALWLPARNAITIAHEGGHGLVALATGRRLEAIRLHSDTSGLTVSRGRPTGLGVVLTLAAGYPAAPLLGLGGAALLGTHRVTLLLWIATVLLLALLVMVRNAYGILTVVLTSAAFLLVSLLGGPEVQSTFACAAVWFLLLGGVRPAFELQAKRRHGGAPDSDADQLARLTHVPAGVWLFFFHAVAICALIGGGRWLLGF